MNRREFLVAGAAGTLAMLAAGEAAPVAAQSASATAVTAGARPKAIVFDTFGTLVEWRSSIVAEATEWGKEKYSGRGLDEVCE